MFELYTMSLNLWLVFLVSVTGIALVPGPNSLLVLSHGARYGYRKTLFTILGGVIGFLILIAIAMFGLGAILQAKPESMVVLRWVGTGYLVWLGLKLFFSPSLPPTELANKHQQRPINMIQQGFFAAISNPKVLLFFTAFLAQFIDPQRALLPQFLVIAITFIVVEFFIECCIARVAHTIQNKLFRNGKVFNQCCGLLFIFIGISMSFT
jgi:homoserine/homoserine lactone efflux protein